MATVRRSMRCCAGVVLCAGLVLPAVGWGQAAKKAERARATAVEIEEVTVVAQKREESIQEVPISITAVTSKQLEEHHVTDLVSLGEITPNVRITAHVSGPSGVSISIRGAAQGFPAVTLQQAAGLYVDGVYIAHVQGSNLRLEDLDHVEVLRGPQGTLYGRNTIAGAINFITKKPTEERSITLQTEVGNYNAFHSRLTVNAPLVGKNGLWQSDALGTLSLRQNLVWDSHDGYMDNKSPTNVKETGIKWFEDLQWYQSMTQVRWQPRKELTVDYTFEYHKFRSSDPAFPLTAVFDNPVTGHGGPFDLTPYVRTSRPDAIGGHVICNEPDPTRCRRPQELTDNRLHTLTVAYDLGEVRPLGALTLKSISGYRSYYWDAEENDDGSPLHVIDIGQRENVQHWSQELQVIGTAPRVNYVLGAYYFGEYANEATYEAFFSNSLYFLPRVTQKLESLAPYGQVTVTPPILRDRLSLTAGIRWSYEHVHNTGNFKCYRYTLPDGSNGCNLHIAPSLDDWQKVSNLNSAGTEGLSPNFSASYQWTDDLMTYFRLARGFKGGGVSSINTDPEGFEPFHSEKLLQYELGFKSQWLDKRLRVNAAGYYSDYSDLQQTVVRVTQAGGFVTATSNVDSAEVWGSELEVTAVPVRGLEATATYGLTLGSFENWLEPRVDPTTGKTVPTNIASERRWAYQPPHSATLDLTYTAPPTSRGTFSANVGLIWNDRQFFLVDKSPAAWITRAPSYYIVNGRLQLAQIPLAAGSLDVAVFGRNLFNRSYRTWGNDFGAFGYAVNTYGSPRTFGLQLTYNFVQG